MFILAILLEGRGWGVGGGIVVVIVRLRYYMNALSNVHIIRATPIAVKNVLVEYHKELSLFFICRTKGLAKHVTKCTYY